jgi:hypothetical protein
MPDSCDVIRKKITMFLATKEMTQTEFLRQIGDVNSNSFQRFMKLKGPASGVNNSTYEGALTFFQERAEAQKVEKAANKKRKRSEEEDDAEPEASSSNKKSGKAVEAETAGPNLNNDTVIESIRAVELSDNKVYDDCDEIRRKLSVLIQTPKMTQSRVCKLIGCNSNAVNRYLSKKGHNEGKFR